MATETRISKVDMKKRAQQPVGVNDNNFVKMGELNRIIDQINDVFDESVDHSTAAINVTATVTAAQLATGYLTSTSAATVTMTLPTAVLLAAQLNATQGTEFSFIVDNTAGSNVVTVAVGTGIVIAKQVNTTDAANNQILTVAASATVGVGLFKIVFTSATAAVLFRIG